MGPPRLKSHSADVGHAPLPQTGVPWRVGKVLASITPGSACIRLDGQDETVSVATHLPLLMPGQSVLVAHIEGHPGLVIAAFPMQPAEPAPPPQAQQPPLLQFDTDTGTLTIQAHQLQLKGLGMVELHCGDAVLRLNAQGEFLAQAQAITQAAIGPYRIEGASIDMN